MTVKAGDPGEMPEAKVETDVVAYLSAQSGGSAWQEVGPSSPETGQDAGLAAAPGQVRVQRDLDEWLKGCLSAHNLIVLAGSGTSLDPCVGGPSMADLWAGCAALKDFREVLGLVRHPPEDRWIENLLSRCKVATDFLGAEQAKPVDRFLGEAEQVIWNRCHGFLKSANLDVHRTFLRRMARRRTRAPRLRIFTTNYDLCFETAAGQLGLVAIDGFSYTPPRRFDPRFFSYDLVRRAAGAEDSNEFAEGVIHLLKLHGSVNWDQTGTGIVQAETPGNPCLIFPTISKYQRSYTQPHLELMSQYMAALREPNSCLAVVGFGFRDDHLTAPIASALDSNPGLRLLVVDRSAREKVSEAGSFYSELATRVTASAERGVMLLNATFAQFAGLIPDLKALSPAEQMERSIKQMAGGR